MSWNPHTAFKNMTYFRLKWLARWCVTNNCDQITYRPQLSKLILIKVLSLYDPHPECKLITGRAQPRKSSENWKLLFGEADAQFKRTVPPNVNKLLGLCSSKTENDYFDVSWSASVGGKQCCLVKPHTVHSMFNIFTPQHVLWQKAFQKGHRRFKKKKKPIKIKVR